MASPQGHKNYTKISNEIIEALAVTDLSNYEFRVFIIILRKLYGFHKKKDWIALTQISKTTGIKLSHISRTVKKLEEKNMIKKNGKVIEIQKDYELWNIPKKVLNQDEKVTQTGNKKLPKQVTNNIEDIHKKLPKQVSEVTQTGNKKLPKQVTTKDNIKETIIKDKVHTPKKVKFDEFVLMTKEENQKLIDKYGIEDTKAFIEKLNIWKGAKGKKTKSDYLTILNWVVEAVLSKKGGNTNGSGKHFSNEREYEDSKQSAARKRFYREE